MGDIPAEKFYDDALCKDVKVLLEMLTSLTNSYRLLVGAADEFNGIALVHRHEAEEAIERADELGDIIDEVERELKKLMKLYLQELACKLEVQQLCFSKLSVSSNIKTLGTALIENLEDNKNK